MRSQQGDFQFYDFFLSDKTGDEYFVKGCFSAISAEPSSASSVTILWCVGSVTKLQLVLSLLLNLNFFRRCMFYFHLLSGIACSLI